MSLYSFQGKVYAGTRSSLGKCLNPQWVGDATLSIKLSTETNDHTESFSGQRQLYGQMNKSTKAETTLTLFEWLPVNIALALYSKKISAQAGTVSGETFPEGLAVGDNVKLDHSLVSNVLLTDSASSPAPLTLDQHYRVASANAGLIEILNLAAFKQPFKAAYGYTAAESYAMFTQAPPERYLLLDGINTETQEPVIVHLYRQKFQPVGELNLHSEDYGSLELTGASLFDSTNAADDTLGGFGRIEMKAAD